MFYQFPGESGIDPGLHGHGPHRRGPAHARTASADPHGRAGRRLPAYCRLVRRGGRLLSHVLSLSYNRQQSNQTSAARLPEHLPTVRQNVGPGAYGQHDERSVRAHDTPGGVPETGLARLPPHRTPAQDTTASLTRIRVMQPGASRGGLMLGIPRQVSGSRASRCPSGTRRLVGDPLRALGDRGQIA